MWICINRMVFLFFTKITVVLNIIECIYNCNKNYPLENWKSMNSGVYGFIWYMVGIRFWCGHVLAKCKWDKRAKHFPACIPVYSRSFGILFAFLLRAGLDIQCRHSIPAPVDRTSTSAWLYKHPLVTCQKTSQAHQWPV